MWKELSKEGWTTHQDSHDELENIIRCVHVDFPNQLKPHKEYGKDYTF
jgi:hypothetical protein